jgi:uncharacterized membrane protein YgcG
MSAAHTRTVAFRGVAVLTATLVLAAMVGTWGASTAEATSYRFWAYWLGSDTGWSFSNQGASRRPADGTVEGWRFAVSEASSSTTPPRHSTSFAQICGSTSPQDGKKRVGLVVDFGSTTDAPKGETPPARIATCVLAPTDANGYAVLAAAVQLRTDGGLICGMNGYPASECGVAVADPTTSPSASPTQGGGGGSGGSAGGGGGGSSDPSSATTPSAQTDDVASDDKGDSKKKTDKSSTKKNESKKAETDPGDDQATAAPAAVSPAAASTPSTAGGSPLGLLAGLGVVVGLLAAAFVVRRRRT